MCAPFLENIEWGSSSWQKIFHRPTIWPRNKKIHGQNELSIDLQKYEIKKKLAKFKAKIHWGEKDTMEEGITDWHYEMIFSENFFTIDAGSIEIRKL